MTDRPERLRYEGGWVVFDWGAEDKWYSLSRKMGDDGPFWYLRSGHWIRFGYHTPQMTTMFTRDPFDLVPEDQWPVVFDFLLEVHSR